VSCVPGSDGARYAIAKVVAFQYPVRHDECGLPQPAWPNQVYEEALPLADQLGTPSHPLRVAVIGSGPAGFYATEELLKQEAPLVAVDLFDRLPTPYGLVRGGVAPDHQKIKSVIKLYERTAQRPRFRFFGNVSYGDDLSLDDLKARYHQILFCTGCETDNRMNIPGEDLPGSYPATIFVGWYNGHPDYRDLTFDLNVESVAVIGNGNVAMDVTRILAKPIGELGKTDIATYALDELRNSRVREIHLLGRRGPAQAAFTNPEIRELGNIEGTDLVIRPEDLELDPLSEEFLAGVKEPTHQRNVDIMRDFATRGVGNQARKILARFFVSPVEILGDGKVEALRIEKNKLVKDDKGNVRARGTGETEEFPVQMVFRSIGYRGTALPDLPFDDWSGIIPNEGGRVRDPDADATVARIYVAGWIKRGPSGVVGTNKPDAIATVRLMLEDAGAIGADAAPLAAEDSTPALLEEKGVRFITFDDWKRLDALETEAGAKLGKPREKFTTVQEMVAALA